MYQHESTTGIHVFPILNPPPSPYHPSGSSQCTSPKHAVSCIEPGLATRFIYDIIHVSMPFSLLYNPLIILPYVGFTFSSHQLSRLLQGYPFWSGKANTSLSSLVIFSLLNMGSWPSLLRFPLTLSWFSCLHSVFELLLLLSCFNSVWLCATP